MKDPNAKGLRLEEAAEAIEGMILRFNPNLGQQPFRIDRRKVVTVQGCRHEFDLFVTIDLGAGYESIYVFECKNWQGAVGKNEVMVFSGKIAAVSASKGFLIANSFSQDAIAFAATDPRVILVHARELPAEMLSKMCQHRITWITQKITALQTIDAKGFRGTLMPFDEATAAWRLELGGKPVTTHVVMESTGQRRLSQCDEESHRLLPPGRYEYKSSLVVDFEGRLRVNGRPMQCIAAEYIDIVEIAEPQLLWGFDVESRGRVLRHAEVTFEDGTIFGPSSWLQR